MQHCRQDAHTPRPWTLLRCPHLRTRSFSLNSCAGAAPLHSARCRDRRSEAQAGHPHAVAALLLPKGGQPFYIFGRQEGRPWVGGVCAHPAPPRLLAAAPQCGGVATPLLPPLLPPPAGSSYAHTCRRTHACTQMPTHTLEHSHAHTYARAHSCLRTYMPTHTHVCTHMPAHIHTHTHTRVHTHARAHTCPRTYVRTQPPAHIHAHTHACAHNCPRTQPPARPPYRISRCARAARSTAPTSTTLMSRTPRSR